MQIIKILLPLLLIGAIGSGIYFFTVAEQERLEQENKAREERAALERQVAEQKAQQEAEQKRLACVENTKYYAITKDHAESAGEDILVKTKTEGVTYECKYEVAEGDFEIKGEEAIYLKNLEGGALITDIGTGPSGRKLRIYDLVSKKQITEKEYFEEFTVASNTLTYLGLAKNKADKKNCKEFDTLMKDFGNANLVENKIVDLKTYLVKVDKTTKCVARQ